MLPPQNENSPVRHLNVSEHSDRLASRWRHFDRRFGDNPRLLVKGPAANGDFRKPAIAVVGTRRPTTYGLRFVREFVTALRGFDWTIISGGALGIDGEAHASALRNRLATQAWLVGPIEAPNPRFHAAMFRERSRREGCALIVPECLEPSTRNYVRKDYWIQRNQWLVGAADVLIVVEAAIPSGTWSSVQAAGEVGIPVFLLPGPVGVAQSEGINEMISNGYGNPILSVEKLVDTLVVEFTGNPYNKGRPEIGLQRPGGKSPERDGHRFNQNLLDLLRKHLKNSEGLGWLEFESLKRSLPFPPDEVDRHFARLEECGELTWSGDQLERG